MIANRLADRQDVRLVERVVEGGAAMPRGAERNPLRRDRGIGLAFEIGGHQPGYVRQHGWGGDLAGQRIDFSSHLVSSTLSAEHVPPRHCRWIWRIRTGDRHPSVRFRKDSTGARS